MRDALERREVAAQQLAAPERPVGAVAGAVEDERERRPGLAVLGEARGGVGVVVLDADELGSSCSSAHFVARYSGWRSWAIDLGLDAEHRRGRARGRRGTRGRRLGVEVAEVRREERLAAARDAERALQLGAGGDERRGAATGSGSAPGA